MSLSCKNIGNFTIDKEQNIFFQVIKIKCLLQYLQHKILIMELT